MFDNKDATKYVVTNEKIKKIAEETNIPYLNKESYMCGVDFGPGGTDDGYRIHYDPHHLTLEGARFMADQIKKQNWFPY